MLRKIASELKYGKAGEEYMCKLLEDYGEERKEEGIQIADCSLDLIKETAAL